MNNITYGSIINAMDGLKKIAESDLTMPVLYRVSKLLKQIDTELEFFNKKRQEIITKYGVKISDEQYKIDDQDGFNHDMNDLLNIKIEGITPVSVPVSERISLSYNTLRSLEGLINITTEEVEK